MKISILDYGAGNITSVKNALDKLNIKSTVIKSPTEISKSDALIVPGVGSFGFAMKKLKETKNIQAIRNFIKKGKPYFGICLGMQILFENSEESPKTKGLGIIKGKVIRFSKGKIPQIGWNEIIPTNRKKYNDMKKPIIYKGYSYFVNSYYVIPDNKKIISGKTKYYTNFTSAIQLKNITAVQFHPEKSGEYGLELIRRWLESFQKE
jgi:imidazole glycerol-phosphate synthase subunit HisH